MAGFVRPYDDQALAEAAALVRAGRAVALPTETVYGLAADAGNAAAVAAIYEIKGRPSFNPLIVHVSDLPAACEIADLPPAADRLARHFWPGPMTMVLPLKPGAPIASLVTAGLSTVAIRVPAHRAMRGLLAASGRPLAAPSANASGGISPTRADHVAASLGDRVPLILDDGPTACGLESTIVEVREEGLRVLRPGPVLAIHLADVGGLPLLAPPGAGGRVNAPGQLASHYAPAKPLRLNAKAAEEGEWLIGFGPLAGDDSLSPAGDLTDAAARLFDCLYRADASPKPAIAVAPIPERSVGVAINDRLRRAAAPRA